MLTDELIAEREEEIQILEKEMLEYQQDRFGPQGDLVLQKRRLIQPIQDQVFNEVSKYGANKKYDFIFDKSADVVMLYSEKRHDISELVLKGNCEDQEGEQANKKEREKPDWRNLKVKLKKKKLVMRLKNDRIKQSSAEEARQNSR